METRHYAKDILKIFPVSLAECYGASRKRSDGHAKKENTLRASSYEGRRERSPAANSTAKTYRKRESVVKEPRPDTRGL
jgi:hypothetical protein